MAVKKLYGIAAAMFLLIMVASYHNVTSYHSDHNVGSSRQKTPQGDYGGGEVYDNDSDYSSGSVYPNGGAGTGGVGAVEKPKTDTTETIGQIPNTSGKYDTLIVIPSSWTQMQNRQWVRQTVFGIKNNLEPCKKNDGRIIYKFYIHGHSTWEAFGIHTAEFMQAQVRDLHGEFMEYNDHVFTNVTVTDRHAVWDDALEWAVKTFIPQEKIVVDKILIFDSTTVTNLPKMEASAKLSVNAYGFIHTWGETSAFAGMASFDVAQQIVEKRALIKENHRLLDIFSATALYFANPPPKFKIQKSQGQLWASDPDQVLTTSEVVAQVYQLEDWTAIVEKLAIAPTPVCAPDLNRKTNIALLTSSYIYVDMCMAEASLPSAENKRDYATKHGYDFVARAAEFAQEEHRGRRLVWGKIGAIQKVLPHYEWLFWMDMDAVIADMDKDLRDIIRMAEERSENEKKEISLIVARPVKDKMLNAGVMLIKNTDWSRRFLNEVQTKVDWYRKSSYEQAAIWEVMSDPKWASGVYLYNKDDHTMNTFPKMYKVGDFIIHFAPAGCPSVPVLEALRLIKDGKSALGVGI
ncbi:galactosyl transferase GMA12/MNN10 family-domain-containing protein [Dissophora ornata]|nr:hypothetical protein BGZ58_003235 [Dissophora ornata]KAI8595258.1 galactosyl transferase GMA12/MNN10 family-domain-containing protein [Dissophora ornata]